MSVDNLVSSITLKLGEAKYRQKVEQGITSQYFYFGMATTLSEVLSGLQRSDTSMSIGKLKSDIRNLNINRSRGEKNAAYTQGKIEGLKLCIELMEKEQ